MNKFADFAEEETLEGDKIKITDMLNREIIVTGYKVTESKFSKSNSERCLKLQFELENKKICNVHRFGCVDRSNHKVSTAYTFYHNNNKN